MPTTGWDQLTREMEGRRFVPGNEISDVLDNGLRVSGGLDEPIGRVSNVLNLGPVEHTCERLELSSGDDSVDPVSHRITVSRDVDPSL